MATTACQNPKSWSLLSHNCLVLINLKNIYIYIYIDLMEITINQYSFYHDTCNINIEKPLWVFDLILSQ